MLALRPGGECCDVDLPPDSTRARICTFECTFCAECADRVLQGRCPNCAGELVPRPRRPAAELAQAVRGQRRRHPLRLAHWPHRRRPRAPGRAIIG